MTANLRRMLRLYALYARMDLHWFTQDTFSCAMCIVAEQFTNIASITGMYLLAVRFGGVGGFSSDEVLWMLGFYTIAGGLYNMCFNFNLGAISRRIGRGQVDHMLMQPIPLWMQMMTEGFIPVSGNSGLLIGLILTGIASLRLGIVVTPAFQGCWRCICARGLR